MKQLLSSIQHKSCCIEHRRANLGDYIVLVSSALPYEAFSLPCQAMMLPYQAFRLPHEAIALPSMALGLRNTAVP